MAKQINITYQVQTSSNIFNVPMLAFNVSLELESHMFLCVLCCLIKEMLIESVVPVQALVSLIMPALCEKTCASVRIGIKSQALCKSQAPV